MTRGLVVGLMIAIAICGCVVKRLVGPHVTGTCDGACAHYIECKAGHLTADRDRCRNECPGVFSDRDSLMMYESLTCKDAVEYIDGTSSQSARASMR
ncbi:MAG TPA: hypothetical protein VGO00_05790 [Kofleriaceae bacterium]|jgi:hypothetical protein|nr:hypothetical protein [Kofleriaceae bacterium]